MKIHSAIFSSVIPGNVNKISEIITNIDYLSELGNKIKTINQIAAKKLLSKNNKYNKVLNSKRKENIQDPRTKKIYQPNRISAKNNEISFHVDNIHQYSPILCRYPTYTRTQPN